MVSPMNIASASAMTVSIHARDTDRPIEFKTTTKSGVSQLIAAMAMPYSPTLRSFLLASILSFPNRPTSDAGLLATSACLLDGRARYGPIGAEDATVARFRLQQDAAVAAVVEELAGVRRHSLGRLVTAIRTGNERVLDHGTTLDGNPACVVADANASGAVFWSS
jgi:hypothetical protein